MITGQFIGIIEIKAFYVFFYLRIEDEKATHLDFGQL